MKPLLSINPSTGLEIRSYNQHSNEEIENILNNSIEAQKNWQNTDLKFKLTCLEQLSEVLVLYANSPKLVVSPLDANSLYSISALSAPVYPTANKPRVLFPNPPPS